MTTKKNISVLQILPSLSSGGVERGVLEVANHLVKNNLKSVVVSSGGVLVQELKKNGSIHIKAPVASKNPIIMLQNISKIRRIIEKHEIDVVHGRSRAPAWSAYFACRGTNAKFLTTFHGVYNFSNPIKKFYNSIMTRGKKTIAVSNFVRRHLIENYAIEEDKIRVIQRGVDHTVFDKTHVTTDQKHIMQQKYNVPKDSTVILMPARFTTWKGQEVLLKALSLLDVKNFYCIMVGDMNKHPAYVSRLQDFIRDNALQGKVIIAEVESNIRCLYQIADIVVSASLEPEAFGRTVIEAASMEKLVVATNIGGASETIIDGVTGIHCLENNPEDLSQKLNYAISLLDSNEHNKITSKARANVAQNFSRQAMLSKTLAVYKELCAKDEKI